MSVGTHVGWKGIRSLRVGVIGSCEMLKVGASSQTLVLWKINKQVLFTAGPSFQAQELALTYKT